MQKRAQKTRSQILTAATALFSKQGLNGATVDEIAADAGVNKQRIYAYFGSKNQLFEAVLLNVFERVELLSEKTLSEAAKHPEKMTKAVVHGFLKVHSTHPDLWRLLAWANLEGPQCTNALNGARKKGNEQLRVLYMQQLAEKRIRPVKFETWLFTILAVTYFRYANELTLSHTLGWTPAGRRFENKLANELNMLFAMEKEK